MTEKANEKLASSSRLKAEPKESEKEEGLEEERDPWS